MAERPPRNNRNPRYANINNDGTNQDENPPPRPSPIINLSQEDMMTIATILATKIQGLVNPNVNVIQPLLGPPPRGIKYY